MNRNSILLLGLSLVILFYSGSHAISLRTTNVDLQKLVVERKSEIEECALVQNRLDAYLSRAGSTTRVAESELSHDSSTERVNDSVETVLATRSVPQAGASFPEVLLYRATRAAMQVLNLRSTENEIRIDMIGSLSGVLDMLTDDITSYVIVPSSAKGVVRIDAAYATRKPHAYSGAKAITSHLNALEQVTSIAATVQPMRAAAAIKPSELTRAFRFASSSINSQPLLSTSIDSPYQTSSIQYQYLGLIKTDHRAPLGVFRDNTTGLVLTAKAGDMVGEWRVKTVEDERAELVGATGKVVVILQK